MKPEISSNDINALLPQSQCRQCGYSGCQPYAEALARDEAPVNLCLPGQESVLQDLARLLGKPPLRIEPFTVNTVYIAEDICIGCTACIKVCPVDAIVGTTKKMHTVIDRECTGCGLCVPACPLDCIYPVKKSLPYLPQNDFLGTAADSRRRAAEHAKIRFDNRNRRLTLIKKAKEQPLKTTTANSNTAAGITALLNAARLRAEQRKHERVAIENPAIRAERLKQAQQKSARRKAQKDFSHGNSQERAAALDFLKKYQEQNS